MPPESPLRIRQATSLDLAVLPDIERAAAAQFRFTPYPLMADAMLASEHVDLSHEEVWVAVDALDQPVAFAIVRVASDSIHIHELDVHPHYARQGLGRRLITAVASWAKARGASALTLSTFDDVPWNGPYYTRLGFRTLNVDALTPTLQAIRKAEAAAGLPMSHRICMQLDL